MCEVFWEGNQSNVRAFVLPLGRDAIPEDRRKDDELARHGACVVIPLACAASGKLGDLAVFQRIRDGGQIVVAVGNDNRKWFMVIDAAPKAVSSFLSFSHSSRPRTMLPLAS